jgi:hypothetical protein
MRIHRSLFNPALPWLAAFSLLAAVLTTGCNNDTAPDISNIKVDLKTYRFDLDLYAIDTNHIADGLQKLATKYPDFLNYYLDTLRAYNIHGHFADTTKGIDSDLRADLTYKDFVNLEDTIKKVFPDISETDKKLTDGFRYMKYYLPAYTPPRIMYLDMGLSKWATFPVDKNTFCIGLDMFLGPQFPYYRSVGVPDYMDPHFRTDYLPVSLFHTVYEYMHPFNPDDKPLIDLMIQRGKEQYFLHKVLPHLPDYTLFGFRQVQVDWCRGNENLIYNFFIHQDLIYSKDAHITLQYVNDGPYAKGLEAPDAPVKVTPGNIGTWLGYKIVTAYMEQHPKMTLAELLDQHTDPAKFLDEAKYRPK